ncbi:ATP-binding cassette domain-containing protein [Duganella sp. CY15W]|uniref:ABC transporter ATP-binding protein n=1 Tax=Duganella sp. CY15W TaxID=2692172 RepID=UPI0013713161|nr:ATP-binding cassette domain-containing protein [Duganella sp. CY15W]MYM29488.1 ATP-binding cassette domain-containing protein [Duganella sp. CY15W]
MELRIEQLNFEYASHPLFRQFNLRLGAGITWLRGENGAGKTSLLKLACGVLAPHTGKIWIDDIEIHAQPLAYRLHCYYCGGDTPQLPWLTVREILDMHVSLYPGTDAEQLNAQLAAFHLLPTLDQPVTTLSLGQHKKMQLSLALSLPVKLLLIDEPFNGLDVDAVAYLRQQLSTRERLQRQCIVLTSHLEPALPLQGTVQL